MTEREAQMISRRSAFSILELATLGLAVPASVLTDQTAGTTGCSEEAVEVILLLCLAADRTAIPGIALVRWELAYLVDRAESLHISAYFLPVAPYSVQL